MKINDFNRPVNLIEIASRNQTASRSAGRKQTESFKDTFSREIARIGDLAISKHARARLYSRGIELSDNKLMQLSQAIDKAATKGSRETLILDDDAAYVASVENRTIVT
ncbi:MAG: hypothetical protein JSV44_07060, partial [Candidatus Zixiibacteriota bacterium]